MCFNCELLALLDDPGDRRDFRRGVPRGFLSCGAVPSYPLWAAWLEHCRTFELPFVVLAGRTLCIGEPGHRLPRGAKRRLRPVLRTGAPRRGAYLDAGPGWYCASVRDGWAGEFVAAMCLVLLGDPPPPPAPPPGQEPPLSGAPVDPNAETGP